MKRSLKHWVSVATFVAIALHTQNVHAEEVSEEMNVMQAVELSQEFEPNELPATQIVAITDEMVSEEQVSDVEVNNALSDESPIQPSPAKNGMMVEDNDTYLYREGVKQYNAIHNVNDTRYYFNELGALSRNVWTYSNTDRTWYYSDDNGVITKEASHAHYLELGKQLYDIVVNINQDRYYYEPQYWGGVQALNKWAYGVKDATWYYTDATGKIRKDANYNYYKQDGVGQSDTILDINGARYYYEPQYWGGIQARNKWAYGVKDATWYYTDATGKIRKEANRKYYKHDGVGQSDTVLDINGARYYYEPQYWGSVQARNKWAYGVKDATWYYTDATGKIRKEANRKYYKHDGVGQSDTVLDINGARYYYEPQYWGGVQAYNKWAYSVKDATWYYTDTAGKIRKEANRFYYKEEGEQHYDILVNINGYHYYYEPFAWNGVLSINKWAYSPKLGKWLKVDTRGHAYFQNPTIDELIALAYSMTSNSRYWPSKSENIRNLKQLNVPLLLQTDQLWANSHYGNDSSRAIWENGCAIVSLAMVDSYFKQRIVDPTEIAKWAGLRHYVYGAGTSWSAFGDFANTFGYRMVNHGRNFNSAMKAVQDGSVGIVSVKAGKYTSGGHLMVIRGYDNNQVLINDPNDDEHKQHSVKSQTPYEVQRDALNYWTFKKY